MLVLEKAFSDYSDVDFSYFTHPLNSSLGCRGVTTNTNAQFMKASDNSLLDLALRLMLRFLFALDPT